MNMVSVLQAEHMKEAQRRAAIFSGDYNFIWLKLKNLRYMQMSGIEYVQPYEYVDERAGNITRFNLQVRTGKTQFNLDINTNTFRYAMLDSPHNRDFLVSHYHLGIWEIEDKEINKEISELSKEREKQIKEEPIKEGPEEGLEKPQETKEICPKCGKPMVLRESRRGRFIACSGFPNCRTTFSVDKNNNKIIRPKPEMTSIKCEKCKRPMLKRIGKRGPFLACSGFPKCRNIKKWQDSYSDKQ